MWNVIPFDFNLHFPDFQWGEASFELHKMVSYCLFLPQFTLFIQHDGYIYPSIMFILLWTGFSMQLFTFFLLIGRNSFYVTWCAANMLLTCLFTYLCWLNPTIFISEGIHEKHIFDQQFWRVIFLVKYFYSHLHIYPWKPKNWETEKKKKNMEAYASCISHPKSDGNSFFLLPIADFWFVLGQQHYHHIYFNSPIILPVVFLPQLPNGTTSKFCSAIVAK